MRPRPGSIVIGADIAHAKKKQDLRSLWRSGGGSNSLFDSERHKIAHGVCPYSAVGRIVPAERQKNKKFIP
jgi:hypothetical protein